MQWFGQAPANIALIKYMGKKDTEKNLAVNPSLSYTLENLFSNVVLEQHHGQKDRWEPLDLPGLPAFRLSDNAIRRFLLHLSYLKEHFKYSGQFIVRSNNNFPQGCGLASSASSFAALTKAACRALSELKHVPCPNDMEQAVLSRHGSGSSCRSFFKPWVIWDEHELEPIDIPYRELIHQVVIISKVEKTISSSEAHKRVETSPLFNGRITRAKQNLQQLLRAFNNGRWEEAFQICWREFTDMHQLFSSASQPFRYLGDESRALLQTVKRFWHDKGDGPLVTMDAGPNVHLLYRKDQKPLCDEFQQHHLVGNYDVL